MAGPGVGAEGGLGFGPFEAGGGLFGGGGGPLPGLLGGGGLLVGGGPGFWKIGGEEVCGDTTITGVFFVTMTVLVYGAVA